MDEFEIVKPENRITNNKLSKYEISTKMLIYNQLF